MRETHIGRWRRQKPLTPAEHAVSEGVRELRRLLGASQKQFSRLVRVCPNSISRWETKTFAPTRLALIRLSKLSAALNERIRRGASVRIPDGQFHRRGRPRFW